MSASAHRYSCDELGACQIRVTPCTGCKSYPFAPGAIERHQRASRLPGTPAQRQALRRWLVAAAAFVLVVTACGFAAGLIAGATP